MLIAIFFAISLVFTGTFAMENAGNANFESMFRQFFSTHREKDHRILSNQSLVSENIFRQVDGSFLGTFLLVSYTQVGKSTMLNLLRKSSDNYDVLQDAVIGTGDGRSVTRQAKLYQLCNCTLLQGKDINIIDFPGLNDNAGVGRITDEKLADMLRDTIFDFMGIEYDEASGILRRASLGNELNGIICLDSSHEVTKLRLLYTHLQNILGGNPSPHMVVVETRVDRLRAESGKTVEQKIKERMDGIGLVCNELRLQSPVAWSSRTFKDEMSTHLIAALERCLPITLSSITAIFYQWTEEAQRLHAIQDIESQTVSIPKIHLREFIEVVKDYELELVPTYYTAQEIEDRAQTLYNEQEGHFIETTVVEWREEDQWMTEEYAKRVRVSNKIGRTCGQKKWAIATRQVKKRVSVPHEVQQCIVVKDPIEVFRAMVPSIKEYVSQFREIERHEVRYEADHYNEDIVIQLPPRPITDFLDQAKTNVKERLRAGVRDNTQNH